MVGAGAMSNIYTDTHMPTEKGEISSGNLRGNKGLSKPKNYSH